MWMYSSVQMKRYLNHFFCFWVEVLVGTHYVNHSTQNFMLNNLLLSYSSIMSVDTRDRNVSIKRCGKSLPLPQRIPELANLIENLKNGWIRRLQKPHCLYTLPLSFVIFKSCLSCLSPSRPLLIQVSREKTSKINSVTSDTLLSKYLKLCWIISKFLHPCSLWIIFGMNCSQSNLGNEFDDSKNLIFEMIESVICNL